MILVLWPIREVVYQKEYSRDLPALLLYIDFQYPTKHGHVTMIT